LKLAEAAKSRARPSAQALELIARLRREGDGFRTIAPELNLRGILSHHGRQWHHEAVQRLLRTMAPLF